MVRPHVNDIVMPVESTSNLDEDGTVSGVRVSMMAIDFSVKATVKSGKMTKKAATTGIALCFTRS